MAEFQAVDLDPKHREIVVDLLRKHAPGCEVRAYGSRVKWKARQHSDLDLAVIGAGTVSRMALLELREALQESDLPFRVDVMNWDTIPDEFRQEIDQQYVVLQSSTSYVRWRRTTLGECGRLVRDSVNPAEVGDISYIGLEHIGENTLQLNGVGRATDVTSAKSRFSSGDILFGKLRPYFRKVVQPRFKGICSTDIWVLRSREAVSQDYLFYLMASPEVVEQAIASSKGTRMPRADWGFLAGHRVVVGPVEEQERIADVLGALDERIELNRRMCETLEEMEQALFKSWFIDFEPVRAKTEDRWAVGESLRGLPAHLYHLFPNHLVDSELGPVPANWHIERLDSVLQLAYGKSLPASKRNSGTVPVFGSNGRVGWHDQKHVDGPGIVVGRKGNPGTVTRVGEDFYPIDTTFFVTLSDERRITHEFTYCALKQLDLAAIGTDSAVPGLSRNLAYMSSLIVPNKEAADAFSEYAFPLWREQHILEQQSICLADLRDTLLSKLISGEVRLPLVDDVEPLNAVSPLRNKSSSDGEIS